MFTGVMKICLGFLRGLEFVQALPSFKRRRKSFFVCGFCVCMCRVLDLGFKIQLASSRRCIKLVKIYIIKIQKCTYDRVKPYNDLSLSLQAL